MKRTEKAKTPTAAPVAMIGLLTKEQLLTPQKLKAEKVPLADGISFVYLREMNGTVRDAFELEVLDKKDPKAPKTDLDNFRGKLVAHCLSDEEGNLILDPKKDAGALTAAFSAKNMSLLAEKATEINGIGEDAKEELVKN